MESPSRESKFENDSEEIVQNEDSCFGDQSIRTDDGALLRDLKRMADRLLRNEEVD